MGIIELTKEDGTKEKYEYQNLKNDKSKKNCSQRKVFIWTIVAILFLGTAFIFFKNFKITISFANSVIVTNESVLPYNTLCIVFVICFFVFLIGIAICLTIYFILEKNSIQNKKIDSILEILNEKSEFGNGDFERKDLKLELYKKCIQGISDV